MQAFPRGWGIQAFPSLVFLYGDKYPLPFYEPYGKSDYLQLSLSLWYGSPMFYKSGILIFIFAENNYSIYAHTILIKTPLLHQSFGPRVLLSLSSSLSLFFRLIPWSAGALWVHFPAWACSVPSPHWEGAWGLCEQSKPHARGFIGFLSKPRNISLFLSPLLSSRLTPDHQVPIH